jgi:2-polyprenyl-3-methyl-5-hydroxy-6-metoxy-1,4-benzoquinol methylase
MTDDDSIERIVRYYGDAEEQSRLRQGWFQLEHARTRELILRHLPPAPATIIDAGGGAGAYACWLAALGHRVHLIDPSPKHVQQAQTWPRQKSVTLGNFRTLITAPTGFSC